MISLAKELQNRGHHMTVCAPEMYRSLLMKQELFMVSSGESYQKLLEGVCEGDRGTDLIMKLGTDVATQFVSLRDALREADVLVGSMLLTAGPSMAEQHKIPYFYVVGNPVLLERAQYPSPGIPAHETGGLLGSRRRKHRQSQWEEVLRSAINHERDNSHLDPVSDMYQHVFCSGHLILAVDPEFLPSAGSGAGTGFLYYEEPQPLDSETEQYLSQGPPPVFVGPVSEKVPNPASILKWLCETALAAGSRVAVSSAWEGVVQSDLSSDCRVLSSHEYSLLLPRMAAVVHAGTTELVTLSVRAGIPQVVAPYLVDQAAWGDRVEALGLGPAPLTEFSLKQVGDAVRQALSDQALRNRARAMGEKIRARNGVADAADAIDKALGL
jgi:UDP:flavonoid glycosyltransferase YjiC (YdhE family)